MVMVVAIVVVLVVPFKRQDFVVD